MRLEDALRFLPDSLHRKEDPQRLFPERVAQLISKRQDDGLDYFVVTDSKIFFFFKDMR